MAGVAPSGSALTLADYAMQSQDPLQMKITDALLSQASVLADVPLVTRPDIFIRGDRMTNTGLPNTVWGRLNQQTSFIRTTFQSYEEQISLIREMIQVDRLLLKQTNWIDDPVRSQVMGAIGAYRYDTNLAFFRNDPALTSAPNSPDAWPGLQVRLDNPATYGLPVNPTTGVCTLKIDANVDLRTTPTTLTASQINAFLEAIGQAFAFLGTTDGTDCVAYCNFQMKNRWATAIRTLGAGGGFDMSRDAYGRMVEKFMNMKVVDIGFQRDEVTPIITSYETNTGTQNGTTPGYTSIYIVRYDEDHFSGWQTGPFKPEYLGRSVENGSYDNIFLEWGCGFKFPNYHSFARLFDIRLF